MNVSRTIDEYHEKLGYVPSSEIKRLNEYLTEMRGTVAFATRALAALIVELEAARDCVAELRIAAAHQTDITLQPMLRRAMVEAIAAYDAATKEPK